MTRHKEQKLEGAEAKLVNIMVRVGRSKGNWDGLITEALEFLTEQRNVTARKFYQKGYDEGRRDALEKTNL